MQFNIEDRWSGKTILTVDIEATAETARSVALGLAVITALAQGAYLSGADLSGADLSGTYLSGANLSRANLSGTYLSGANLSRANLSGADLSGAYLSGANLSRANLSGADLSGANLSRANLSGAYLSGANLSRANLSGADLSGAYLSGANLSRAYNVAEVAALPDFQIPQEGDLIVFKKTTKGVAKLRVPAAARRTATPVGRKCRAEFVEVIEAPAGARSLHDNSTLYEVGTTVHPDKYDDSWHVECTSGIHFFLTREEAANY